MPAFLSLKHTSAYRHYRIEDFPQDRFVTEDFRHVLAGRSARDRLLDDHTCPVQHVLSVRDDGDVHTPILISLHEAMLLADDIRHEKKVTLHTFVPRQHPDAASFDNLTVLNEGRAFNPACLPWKIRVQLIMFAGQLWYHSLERATEVQKWLRMYPGCKKFFEVLASKVRLGGAAIEGTHLARLLDGEDLREEDFDWER
jgi:hypothetical protein